MLGRGGRDGKNTAFFGIDLGWPGWYVDKSFLISHLQTCSFDQDDVAQTRLWEESSSSKMSAGRVV